MRFCFKTILLFAPAVFLSQQLQSQVQIEISPGPLENKDVYLNSVNYYGSPEASSLIASAWTYWGSMGYGRSFLNFDLPDIPQNATNFSATLFLSHDPTSAHLGHYGNNAAYLERVTENWDYTQINWLNQPDVSSMNAVLVPQSESTDQDYILDVTDLITDCYKYPDESYGLRLKLIQEDLYTSLVFASGDHPDATKRPRLIITYDSCDQILPDYFTYEAIGQACQFYYEESNYDLIEWDFGNGYGAHIQNPLYFFPEPGTYIVSLTVANGCDSLVITQTVHICEFFAADFSYEIEDNTVYFTNLSPEGYEYYWDFGNGFFSWLEHPEFQYDTLGNYEVCLQVTNTCTTMAVCKELSIEKLGTPEENNDPLLVLFPNPVKEILTIQTQQNPITEVHILDLRGVIMMKKQFSGHETELQLPFDHLISGSYFVQIQTTNSTHIHKIVKH